MRWRQSVTGEISYCAQTDSETLSFTIARVNHTGTRARTRELRPIKQEDLPVRATGNSLGEPEADNFPTVNYMEIRFLPSKLPRWGAFRIFASQSRLFALRGFTNRIIKVQPRIKRAILKRPRSSLVLICLARETRVRDARVNSPLRLPLPLIFRALLRWSFFVLLVRIYETLNSFRKRLAGALYAHCNVCTRRVQTAVSHTHTWIKLQTPALSASIRRRLENRHATVTRDHHDHSRPEWSI